MDFFYSDRDSHSSGRHVITDKHIEVIRNLRFRMGESVYYSPMPTCSLEDNEEMLTEAGLTMNEIWKSVHFITMLGKHKNTSNVFDNLLRQMYLNEDSEGGFTTGYKRPFGNSDVLGDVRYELIQEGFYGNMTEKEEEELDQDYKEEQKVLESFMKWFTEDFLKNFEIEFRAFEFDKTNMFSDAVEYWNKKGVEKIAHILHSWKLDKSELRNQKLNSIGI
jgi:hypothetical protein